MKTLIKLIAPTILALFSACDNEGETTVVVTEIPKPETLDTLCTVVPEYAEHMTNSLNTAGDYYVAFNYRSPFHFSVYDQDFQLVDTVLPLGHGHNEMMSPSFFGQWSGNPESPEIYVFESEANKFSKFNIINFNGVEPVATLPSSGQVAPTCAFLEPDSTVLGVSLILGEAAKIFQYNILDNSLTFVEDYLTFDKSEAFYTSQCGMAVRGDGEQIAVAYKSFQLICLFDKDLNLKKKIYVGEEVETATLTTKDNHNGFVWVKYVGDKIVALGIDENDMNDNVLMVFDQEGELMASYWLPNSLGFCYNEKQRKLISVAIDPELGYLIIREYKAPAALMQ